MDRAYDLVFSIFLALLGAYPLVWMACVFNAYSFVESWAIRNGWSPVRVDFFLPMHTPNLGQTGKQRLFRITVEDGSENPMEIWVAVSPCVFGIILAARADVMKINSDRDI